MDNSKLDALRNPPAPPPLVILLKEPAQKQLPRASKIIDLPSKSTKMALHQRFCSDESTEHSRGEVHCYYRRMVDASGREIFVSKLPSGEYLVEQSPKNTSKQPQTSVNSMNSLKRKIHQKINVKRVLEPEKIKRSQVRRNPSRFSRQKCDEDYPHARPILALKRRRNDLNSSSELKKLKLSDVPYMNTRSVTKRLYNVGAILQTPTIHDEVEWRDWPVHGMHERPVYHPQVGLAVEFIGRCFTSLDGESYHEIPRNSEVDIISLTDQFKAQNKISKRSGENGTITFENCMHRSFHSVLSYAAQVMSPDYKKIDEKISAVKALRPPKECERKNSEIVIVNSVNEERNKEKQPDPSQIMVKPSFNAISLKNQMKLQHVLGQRKKNTLIFLKSLDLITKKDHKVEKNEMKNNNWNSEEGIARLGVKNDQHHEKMKSDKGKAEVRGRNELNNEKLTSTPESQLNEENVITEREKIVKELIANTALLFCTAMGTFQEQFAKYMDGLIRKDIENWLKLHCS